MQPQGDDPDYYEVRWLSRDSSREDGRFSGNLCKLFIDLAPFMIARELLEQGFNPARHLVVKLYGADFDLARAPLGQIANTPIINPVPVKHLTRRLYYREQAS